MFERQVVQLTKQFKSDRANLERLLVSYRDPDPRIVAIDNAVAGFAHMMQPQAAEWARLYDAFSRRDELPSDLRLLARANRKLAAELDELLTELALPWLKSQATVREAG